MTKSFGWVCILAAVCCMSAPSLACLRVHPTNPHYFLETTTGKPVLIASVSSIVPTSTDFDYVAGIADMGRRRIAYSRAWHFLPWAHENAVWPWARSSTPGAPMGGNKIDMNAWNPTYWTRMTDAMSRAHTVGTYAEIHLFDRCGLSPFGYDRYQGNPWASDNNINSLEMPAAVGYDGTPEFYQWSSRPNLRSQQERYIRKMIDETIAYPNVIYEIDNEHWQSNSAGWADHYGQFVKDHIAANYPDSPRLVSYNSIESDSDLDQCYTMSAIDIVNKHYGGELESNPSIVNGYIESRWHFNKPINIDEFANGVEDPALLREQCWTIITSGGNFHIEDSTPPARPEDLCENIRSFIALSGWDFISSSPDRGMVANSAGYCMKNSGVEYVCYFPTGGDKTVSIAAGNYREQWWNPATGGFYNTANFSHGGGSRVFSPPGDSDWVLHISASPSPTTVLASKPVTSAITVNGNSSDWNLAEFTTQIRGGNTGTGDIGLVGFDTNGVCHVGGHYDGWQILPSNAADHTARVYARDDSTYLYFLIRCDDNHIQYPNGTATNYLNDCVEIYIDPGHDHGLTPMSGSTSDVRLVIDAYNRRNVYDCDTAYATAVLGGVTSAVVRDATGWWLEARITKTALDPDIPSGAGTIGIDFVFRDNDSNNSTTLTTITSWRDPQVSTTFPSKMAGHWGDLSLQAVPDTTAPSPATSFTATPGDQQVSLSWHNPSDSDFTGTMIRRSTAGYPTGPTDGVLVLDKPNSPNTDDGHVDAALTNGTVYYYSAFAHDAVPNHATRTDASATPADTTAPGPVTAFSVIAGNERNFLMWTNPSDLDYAGVKILFKTASYPSSPTDGTVVYQGADTSCAHDGLETGTTYYYAAYARDEVPNYSTGAQANGTPVYFSPVQAKMLGDGEELTLTAGVISVAFGDSLYVQCATTDCGPCGIKVIWPSYGLQVGQSATVKGTILTDAATGERYIRATWLDASANEEAEAFSPLAKGEAEAFPPLAKGGLGGVDPIGLNNITLGGADSNYSALTGAGQRGVLGGSGTNNIGLLVRVWGKVTQRDTDGLAYFYIDDGSNLRDTTKTSGANNVGVRVKADPSGYLPGDYATLTCISSCFKDASGNIRRQVIPVPAPQVGPVVLSDTTFDSDASGWTIATWKANPTNYQPGTMAWASSGGSPDGCMASTGSGTTDNEDTCTREGAEIHKTISTWNHGGIKVYYDLKVNSLGPDHAGSGIGNCTNDHGLIDEQITVFYSIDGGMNWIEAEYVTRTALLAGYQSYGTRVIDLTGISACDNNPNFALRFRWQFNQATDTGWLDNIRIEASN